jgi:hypothetical protein
LKIAVFAGLVPVSDDQQRSEKAEFALIPGPEQVQCVFEVAGLVDRLPFRAADSC